MNIDMTSAARSFVALTLGIGLAACAVVPTDPTVARPTMVSVAQWGGAASTASHVVPQRIDRITIHHGGVAWKRDADVAAYMRRLQQWSRLTKRWSDSPYHYIIAPDGRIFVARDEGVPGDTNTEYDPKGHALVMLLGNFDEAQPTPQQLATTVNLVAWIASQHQLTADQIASHKDFSSQTACPGKNLSAHIASGWLRSAVAARMQGQPVPEMAVLGR